MSDDDAPATGLLGKDDVYLVPTLDGSNTLYSKRFGATYHSIFGAVSESKHTYLQRCLCTQVNAAEIRILEFGFGTGLNAFLAFLFSQTHHKQITYKGVELFALDLSVVRSLDYPGYLAFPDQAFILDMMHEKTSFSSPFFEFQRVTHWDELSSTDVFHCIFLDAFSPEVHPAAWSQEMLAQLYNLTMPGGCLVTYCSKGDVRRAMENSGFQVLRIAGAPGKRQMLQAFRQV